MKLATTTKILFLNISMVILLLPFIRSLLLMITGKNLFIKAKVNIKSLYYPLINLFTLLDIVDLPSFFGILYFIPYLNVLLFIYISYRLSILFNTGKMFRIGLIIFMDVFIYLLSKGPYKYKIGNEEFFKVLDSVKRESLLIKDKDDIEIVDL